VRNGLQQRRHIGQGTAQPDFRPIRPIRPIR
jgi:hypothetical protein